MKLGIVSCYFINNYGSILQAYALQEYFSAKGIECDTISVEGLKPYLNAKKRQYYFRNIHKAGLFLSKLPMIYLKALQKINYRNLGHSYCERVRKFDDFRTNFNLSNESAVSLGQLADLSLRYDRIVVGSDQLWRPDNIFPEYYTLGWVPDHIPKVSYATSFGVAELDRRDQSKARIFLNRLSAISVRESSGCRLVRELTGKTPCVVCDPVFLLTKNQWQMISDTSRCPNRKYIFTYFLGGGRECRKFAEKLSAATGLPVLGVIHNDSYIASDESIDNPIADCSPNAFLGLLFHAEYICTDSFHATAFSTIFHKNFFAFRRFKSKKHGTNARIESFLKMIGLESRLISNPCKADDIVLSDIDYETVNPKISSFINKSCDFIEKEILQGVSWNVQEKGFASQPDEEHWRDRLFSKELI